jgi:subtilisin family serine protease
MKKNILLLFLLLTVVIFSQTTPKVASKKFPTLYDSFRIENGDTLIGFFMSSDVQTTSSFKNAGGKIYSTLNNITTGTIPLNNLSTISNNIQWMTPAGVAFPVLDESQKVVNAKIGRDISGMGGNGVIIGIVDMGVDPNQADFKKPDGTSRILRIWDQSLPGNPPNTTNYNYGYEWNQNNMQNCFATDLKGHGTQVGGIAASSGMATGNNQPSGRYIGMAPNSDLIFVKLPGEPIEENNRKYGGLENMVNGIKYITDRALELNKPCVINVSLASNMGPKDGTSPVERNIDDIVTSMGKLIVVAAGNFQTDKKHSEKTGPSTVTFTIHNPSNDPVDPRKYDSFFLEIFYPNTTNYTISIESPNPAARCLDTYDQWNNNLLLKNLTISSGNGTGLYDPNGVTLPKPGIQGYITESGLVCIHNNDYHSYDNPYPYTSLRCIRIFIEPVLVNGNWVYITPTEWKIKMTGGTGTYDSYIVNISDYDLNRINFISSDATNYGNITEPACAQNVLTVGSMNSKNTWLSKSGQIPVQPGYPINSKSNFSSEGPTNDGRVKPEIYAPGAWIMSSKSITAFNTTNDEQYKDLDNVHVISTGTSLAAPHVTGAAALLLQQNPTWTPTQIKNRLIQTANNQYGYPLLDIQAALCKENDLCKQNPGSPIETKVDPSKEVHKKIANCNEEVLDEK